MSDTVIPEADGQPRSNWRDAVLHFRSHAVPQSPASTTPGASDVAGSGEGHGRALDDAGEVH
ncbi:MAG: hypothetical protein AB7F99_15505 [Vicinamibacterales bacterium]